ncbi:MAG: hypothetical protein KBC72_14195 [Acinetobacter sp.]|nr:hypothetical protein [Acinetobacter sp.]
MQVQFNTRVILPSVYRSEKDGKEKSYLSTTVFSPQKYNLMPTAGMMPVEHIQAVLEECADNAQEVEIQFVEQQTKFGPQMQIFSVKPLPKKDLTQPQKP